MATGSNGEIRAAGQLAAAPSPTFKPLEKNSADNDLVVCVPAPGGSPPSAAGGAYKIVRTGN